MTTNTSFNEKKQEEHKEQKLEESSIESQQNCILEVFDTNILSQIFAGVTKPTIKQGEDKEDYKSYFSNCISFSLTSKTCNLIAKQAQFSILIFKQEKIENIDFNIYLKLKYILKQKEINQTFNGKEELLNNILLYTSKNGIYNLIPTLIQNGANVDYETKYRYLTALSYSCRAGLYKTSKILIQNNSNINSGSILELSCIGGNLKLVKYLINLGLNINGKNSIIFAACESGNLDLVKYLIDEKDCDFKFEDRLNNTILFNACKSGNIDLVKYLINEKKLDINHQNESKETPIFLACKSGSLNLVKYLINETKCNFKHKNYSEETILYNACESGNLELVKYLIEEKKFNPHHLSALDEGILWSGVWCRNLKLIEYLMNNFQLDINKLNDESKPILYRVIEDGNLELINCLLSLGADPAYIDDPDIIKQLEEVTGKSFAHVKPKPKEYQLIMENGKIFALLNGVIKIPVDEKSLFSGN